MTTPPHQKAELDYVCKVLVMSQAAVVTVTKLELCPPPTCLLLCIICDADGWGLSTLFSLLVSFAITLLYMTHFSAYHLQGCAYTQVQITAMVHFPVSHPAGNFRSNDAWHTEICELATQYLPVMQTHQYKCLKTDIHTCSNSYTVWLYILFAV